MGPDEKICHCYGVSLRKLWNFARGRRPARPSQMSECLGAGTGCGWCIPTLKRIFDEASQEQEKEKEAPDLDLTPDEYARRRKAYIDNKEPKNEF
jgi:bacterioferritin-associated ferredoxin